MLIRPETPADYPALADLNFRAFGRLEEMLIVSLLRQRPGYDPELSLVAVSGSKIVGHAFFSLYTIRLLNQDVRGVNLAPLAVLPGYQRQGVGMALLEEGHRIARKKGALVTYLLGHPTYYPRAGYLKRAMGSARLKINASTFAAAPLESRAPQHGDVPALQSLWQHELGAVDFTSVPGGTLTEWVTPEKSYQARVYLRDGQIAGYTRGKPGEPLVFLASDHDAALGIAAAIVGTQEELTLPLHPYSASFGAFSGESSCVAWDAGMAMSLTPNPFDEYYEKVQRDERAPAMPIWGTAFDIG